MIGKSFDRYTLDAQIGRGGMGVVYRAHDATLGRDVAIKVISADRSSRIAKERFQREIQLAAGLQHPNIVPVHDVGELEGHLYYVMPLVEGQTLRERMQQAHGLALDEALGYARDIGQALDYAHRKGIVHRDIKPDNILITNGQALVVDFGLALAVEDSEDQRLTQEGTAVGTPLYMSPEQAWGGRPLDRRSDIYSLACLLYEMLAGSPPFVGANSLATLQRHMNDPVPHLRKVRADVRLHVDQALAKALAKHPEERFAFAREFVEAIRCSDSEADSSPTRAMSQLATLERRPGEAPSLASRAKLPAAIVSCLLALALMYGAWIRWSQPTRSSDPAVAVLPFTNLSEETSLDLIGIGVAQTLITQLSTVSSLRILAGSSDGLVGDIQPNELAHKLGASHIVRGTIQKDAERLQVTVNLIRADASVSWGGTFESSEGDLFELQRRISTGLSEALALQLSESQRAGLQRRPTDDRDAYAEYVQGRAFLQRRDLPGNLERATTLLQSATSRDTDFALAHAALGETFWQRYRASAESSWVDEAMRAARKARDLDPDHPYVRYALAVIYEGTGRADDAIQELSQALELQPNHDAALALLGKVYADQNDTEEAILFFDRAIEGRPGYWGHYREKGKALLRSGRYQEASQAFARVTELQPDSAWGFQQLGVSFHMIGDLDRALVNYEKAVAIGPSPGAYSNMGTMHYRRGEYQKAIENYSRALELRPSSQETWRNLGDAYRRIERSEEAEEAYVRAIELVNERLRVNSRSGRLYAMRALYHAKLQREAEALGDLDRAEALGPREASLLTRRAEAFALLGHDREALDALEQAVQEGLTVSEITEIDELESLRHHPRYIALVN